jgi:hypothetical protein
LQQLLQSIHRHEVVVGHDEACVGGTAEKAMRGEMHDVVFALADLVVQAVGREAAVKQTGARQYLRQRVDLDP